ncbi:MAG: hypothetical protein ACYTE0_11750 [Planctomycetota bacterium]|jgi:hypothetical protein
MSARMNTGKMGICQLNLSNLGSGIDILCIYRYLVLEHYHLLENGMIYKPYGQTGIEMSAVGFGGMIQRRKRHADRVCRRSGNQLSRYRARLLPGPERGHLRPCDPTHGTQTG